LSGEFEDELYRLWLGIFRLRLPKIILIFVEDGLLLTGWGMMFVESHILNAIAF
jgi:hypothetical protein